MFNAKMIGVMACDEGGVVGHRGVIPWHYPSELAHFRSVIKDKPIVLGRKSFEVMPKSILANRTNIVFSRAKRPATSEACFVSSIDEFLSLGVLAEEPEVFMVGGAELANLFLENNIVTEFILTKVKGRSSGDARLNLKLLDGWQSECLAETQDYNIYRLMR